MKVGAFTRTALAVSGLWLIGYGIYGMTLRSKVEYPFGQVNLIIENVRSRNAQTLGLGGMMLALSAIGANPIGRVCGSVESAGIWVTDKVAFDPTQK